MKNSENKHIQSHSRNTVLSAVLFTKNERSVIMNTKKY